MAQLTAAQLSAIEASMEEEHRRDREALARLKRYATKSGTNGRAPLATVEHLDGDDDIDSSPTIIAKVERVMTGDPEKKWTVPSMLTYLQLINFPLAAKKPAATLGLVFKKLQRRGRIRIVRRGAGRNPHVWRGNTPQEGESEISGKSERPTQGQAVHVH